MIALIWLFVSAAFPVASAEATDRRMVLTFDDLPAQRAQALSSQRIVEINQELVALLASREIPAIGFVNESKLKVDSRLDPGRVEFLELWLDAGLELGNHCYSHLDLHHTPLDDYLADIARGEEVTRQLLEARGLEPRYFRHPFLHTGLDLTTRRAVERFLGERSYRVAPVTIDNSEWIFARAYDAALDQGDHELQGRLGRAYVDYMVDMTVYYEGQSTALFERAIPQVMLLHANALNARHLATLIERLGERGYEFIDLDTALADPAYESRDNYTGSGGITWLHRWALTRDVDRSMLRGEPTTPEWVQEAAGLRESPRGKGFKRKGQGKGVRKGQGKGVQEGARKGGPGRGKERGSRKGQGKGVQEGAREGGPGKGVQERGSRKGGPGKGVQERGSRKGGPGKGVQERGSRKGGPGLVYRDTPARLSSQGRAEPTPRSCRSCLSGSVQRRSGGAQESSAAVGSLRRVQPGAGAHVSTASRPPVEQLLRGAGLSGASDWLDGNWTLSEFGVQANRARRRF